MQLQSKHDSATSFVDAGNAYKKADPQGEGSAARGATRGRLGRRHPRVLAADRAEAVKPAQSGIPAPGGRKTERPWWGEEEGSGFLTSGGKEQGCGFGDGSPHPAERLGTNPPTHRCPHAHSGLIIPFYTLTPPKFPINGQPGRYRISALNFEDAACQTRGTSRVYLAHPNFDGSFSASVPSSGCWVG